ncbi:beta-ketoacyl-[acyl-carrier-protein] synthase family protein [Streptacidiphilus albus]|uniref:beta-ketoacyl-[acyl-carrier-protein] synthase family protein n=1 Tax=Streptacidiphilus albus TaxID=105425 RepID=UPI00054B3C62|nr:beta-ketoacyl-[acyl-carrier-protein] synthase family protein [Streptacidiphilus albus]
MTRDTTAVVTGLGLVTSGGTDVASTWASVLAGRPTAAHDPEMQGLPVDLSCRVTALDHPVLSWPGCAHLDPYTRFGLVATAQALEQADLPGSGWDPARVAVVGGILFGGTRAQDTASARLAADGPDRVSPYFLTGYMANMLGAAVSLHFGITGPGLSVTTACASGTTALGVARDLLALDHCDIALVVSSEAAVSRLIMTGFAQVGTLSRHGSHPFDADRDGFVMAEGAGALVLERPAFAAARGAAPLARLIGYGAATDAHHLVAPQPEGRGLEQALRTALADAGVTAADVGHINAHGTSTKANDRIEGTALRRVFPHRPPVTSAKGALGHTLAAAGTIEAALTVLALNAGKVPPTAGLRQLDPGIDLDVVSGTPRTLASGIALSTSAGFGGHNAVAILASA